MFLQCFSLNPMSYCGLLTARNIFLPVSKKYLSFTGSKRVEVDQIIMFSLRFYDDFLFYIYEHEDESVGAIYFGESFVRVHVHFGDYSLPFRQWEEFEILK